MPCSLCKTGTASSIFLPCISPRNRPGGYSRMWSRRWFGPSFHLGSPQVTKRSVPLTGANLFASFWRRLSSRPFRLLSFSFFCVFCFGISFQISSIFVPKMWTGSLRWEWLWFRFALCRVSPSVCYQMLLQLRRLDFWGSSLSPRDRWSSAESRTADISWLFRAKYLCFAHYLSKLFCRVLRCSLRSPYL